MATAGRTLQILPGGQSAAPFSYVLPASTSFDLLGVRTTFDGTAAAGAFLPCVQIFSDAGVLMAQTVGVSVAAGGSADVTFAPFLRNASGGITRITSTDGSVTITAPTGPTTDLSVPASGGAGMVLICKSTLLAPQASFDTNTILGGNIPQTYTNLRLEVMGRTTTNAALNSTLNMILNNDTGANYTFHKLQVSANSTISVSPGTTNNAAGIGNLPSANALASWAGQVVVDIANYTTTTFAKTWTGQNIMSADLTTSDRIMAEFGGLYDSTSALTRLALTLNLGNFDTGTVFTLYGLA